MRCVTSQITAEDCQPFMAKPAEIVAYRVVIGPASLLTLADGGTPLEITAGKMVLLLRNDRHTLASAPGLRR
jgi:hypothetical protein